MKHIKSLLLLAVALPFFASCSDDDNNANTAECTVGFESTTVSIDETSGLVQVPITVSGRRNGPIHLTIETAPTGTNGAEEGTNYIITDKTLTLNADTLSTGTIYVEVKPVDDLGVNPDRSFTMTIASADGAEISTAQTTVTIADNDGDFYLAFAGSWTMTATSLVSGSTVSIPLTLTTSPVGTPNYENVINCTTSNILGADESYSWKFYYDFDENSGEGALILNCGETICADYGLFWAFPDTTGNLVTGAIYFAQWGLDESGSIPSTITLNPNLVIYLSFVKGVDAAGNYVFGAYDAFYNITLTRNLY